jgi:DNA-binding GntR family transcriptional regulator
MSPKQGSFASVMSNRGRPRSATQPKPTGAQVVYEALRRAIISVRLAPGEPLEELQLCKAYKVSRTPVREALIRLASEDLVELEPNRGAKVAALQFVDVVDHYEAMDIFQPLICHFAAVRRTPHDLAAIKGCLDEFRHALAQKNAEAIILANFNLHGAIAAACHNRSLEKAYRRMLTDKLRIAQQGMRASADAEHELAQRFRPTFRFSESLAAAIANADPDAAERVAGELNAYIRTQVIDILSTSLGTTTKVSRGRLKEIHAMRRLLDDPRKAPAKSIVERRPYR